MKNTTKIQGFTLIEALIAVLVLSIGLLGVAAMQLKALQSAHMGYQRALASLVAIDAQERAWAELSREGECPAASVIIGSNWPGDWSDHLVITSDPPLTGEGPTDDCEYTVTLEWGEARVSSDEVLDAFVYSFRLPQL